MDISSKIKAALSLDEQQIIRSFHDSDGEWEPHSELVYDAGHVYESLIESGFEEVAISYLRVAIDCLGGIDPHQALVYMVGKSAYSHLIEWDAEFNRKHRRQL